MIRRCPVCNSIEAVTLHSTNVLDVWPVVSCNVCGMVYADTPHPQGWYDEYYSRQGRYTADWTEWNTERYEEQTARIANLGFYKTPDVSIVDVGCGTGGLVKELIRRGFTFVTGIDPSKGERLQDLKACDLAILSHVLEHVCDVQGAVRHLAKVAKAVYVEVPDASRYRFTETSPYQQFNEEHINHFDLARLTRLLVGHGFMPRAMGQSTCDPAEFPVCWVYAVQGEPSLADAVRGYCDQSAHLMADIEEKIKGIKGPVICWGIGALARRLEKKLVGKVCGAVDSSAIDGDWSWPGYAGTISVQHPNRSSLLEMSYSPILVTTILHKDSVLKQIAAMGLKNEVITLGD